MPTAFHGYDGLVRDGAKITALYIDGAPVTSVKAGDDAVVVLDHTPFYAESGGQVGDTGELRNATARAVVEDTTKIQADVFGHQVHVVEGAISVGDTLNARVDADKRIRTQRNHSVTHLMHKALREVLGSHVQQKGSLVDADMGAYYNWINQQRLPGSEKALFLAWFEDHREALAISPVF
jgi:alanyl-tRNA synthetase